MKTFTLSTILTPFNLYLYVCDTFAVTTADVGAFFNVNKGVALRHLKRLSNDLGGLVSGDLCEDDQFGPQSSGHRKPGKHLIWQCWEDSQSAYYTDKEEWLDIEIKKFNEAYTGPQGQITKEAVMAKKTSNTTKKSAATKKAAAKSTKKAAPKKAAAKKAPAKKAEPKQVPVSKFVMGLVVAQVLSDEDIYAQVCKAYPAKTPSSNVAALYRKLLNEGLRTNPATGEKCTATFERIGGPAKAEPKAKKDAAKPAAKTTPAKRTARRARKASK
jgi:hypothetical protein